MDINGIIDLEIKYEEDKTSKESNFYFKFSKNNFCLAFLT